MKTRYGIVYGLLRCFTCDQDFTSPDSLLVSCGTDSGTLGEFNACLEAKGEDVGLLREGEGLVEAGKHTGTCCGICGESLEEYEYGFDWEGDDQQATATAAAINEVLSWPIV